MGDAVPAGPEPKAGGRAEDQAVIRLTGVGVRRGERRILDGVDWTVRPGEDWAVVGPNGSGKTTLLGVLNGYVWPSAGSVDVLGARLGRVVVADLRRRLGLVSAFVSDQVLALGAERVLAVVLSGRPASIGLYRAVDDDERARAMDLLAAFDAQGLAGRTFQTLSQGERQRVLLARAWMGEPDVLLLDEPAAGLDVAAREELVAAIDALGRRSPHPTLLHVTHHVEEIAAFVGNALLLRDGRVVAAGAKADVLTDELVSRTFGVALEVSWLDGRAWLRARRRA